jgi:hypothetical protein
VDTAAATLTTLWIDRLGYESGSLAVFLGAASGTPTSFTVNAKIQDATDDAGAGAADYKSNEVDVDAITALTADNGETVIDFSLAGARRYIGVVVVVAFVAGTSPKIEVASTIALGGAAVLPVVD